VTTTPLERRYGVGGDPLPRLRLRPPAGRLGREPFDLTAALTRLTADLVARLPPLAHIEPARLLVTLTPARVRGPFGLQARCTPMRLKGGATTARRRGRTFRVQRYVVDGVEVLYLVTFVVPRFLDLSAREKLVTVVHELFHIGERFDGDLRRHPGRCYAHSASKKGYDAEMGVLADRYLATAPNPAQVGWLTADAAGLASLFGGVVGVTVPRPKLVPVG
jgi:hypothetical protein